MTREEHTNTWRKNIQAKAQEIQQLLSEVIGLLPQLADEKRIAKFEEKFQAVSAKVFAMHDLYGPSLAPQPLQDLHQVLARWKSNLSDPALTIRLAQLWKPIGSINGEEDEPEITFTSILEKHKQDETLQQCLGDLIAALEKLLEEDDDILKRQAADDLERILKELKNRRNQSLFDLKPWIEFALVTTGAIFDYSHGTILGSIAAGAVVAAKNSDIRISHLVQQAGIEFIESLKMKGIARSEATYKSKLTAATIEEIQNALKGAEGLKSLPEHGALALPPAVKEQE